MNYSTKRLKYKYYSTIKIFKTYSSNTVLESLDEFDSKNNTMITLLFFM